MNKNESNRRRYMYILLLVLFFSIFSLKLTSGLINSSIINYNGSSIDYLQYDSSNQTVGSNYYGSDSYMDNSFTNPNVVLRLCHPNLTKYDRIDLAYTGMNRSYFSSLFNFFPQVTDLSNYSDTNGSYYCTNLDVDISGSKALYPGYIHPIILSQSANYSNIDYLTNDTIVISKVNQELNGSYEIGVQISGYSKIYSIYPKYIYDDQGNEIEKDNEEFLIFSLVNASGSVLSEEKISANEEMEFDGNFKGGEKVYVNEIDSLEILSYDPCGPINDSGYYLFNKSANNLNQTCVTINNSENIVLNFGGEVLDGDGDDNGSLSKDSCAITIENSDNIAVENLRSQQFYYGICIKNSNISIYGNYSSSNFRGAKVDERSNANFYSIYFQNNDSEIISQNDSVTSVNNITFVSAKIKSEFRNAKVRSVNNPPEFRDNSSLVSVGQYIEFIRMNGDSYATMGFYYTYPMRNNVSLNNVSIFQYHGDRYENLTNGSYWESSNWTELYTIVDPQQQLIRTDEDDEIIYNFSIFAPYGLPNITEKEVPEPTPEPEPTPRPTSGSSPGTKGSVPQELQLDFEVEKNITLMQGQAGEMSFNITNIGDVFAPDVSVGPQPPNGWDYTNSSLGDIFIQENRTGEFQISPYSTATPKVYDIPVKVYIEKEGIVSSVLTEYVKVKVIPREEGLLRLNILEYPPVIKAAPSSLMNVSFLSKNVGDEFLGNILLEADNSSCINSIIGKHNLAEGDTKTLKYLFNFTDSERVCDVNLKFYSNDRLVGFVPSKVMLKEEFQAGMDLRTYLIIIYLIWTTITAYIIGRKRKHKKEK